MKHQPLLIILILLIGLQNGLAQVKCGFDHFFEKLSNLDPNYKSGIAEMNIRLRQYIAESKNDGTNRMQAALYFIPVVVHVIHTGGAVGTDYNPADANITGAINYLNAVYDGTYPGTLGAGDIQIKFVLATKDPNNNATTGINRVDGSGVANYTANGISSSGPGAAEIDVKNLIRWDPFKYYNIWLVNKIDGCDGLPASPCSAAGFTTGYAYFPLPANANAASRDRDGTVMLSSQMHAGQGTLPHEIGHAFNLFHPFQGETVVAGANTCPPNANPAVDGDQCADTEPITNPADDGAAVAFACRTGANPCSPNPYNDNTEKNYMNYTSCENLFTNDQKTRMLAAALITMRASLATSWANNQGSYPVTFTAPVAPGVTPTSAGGGFSGAGILSVELNGRKVHSLRSSVDGGYVNNATKWYDLFELQKNTAYSLKIGLLNLNVEQVGVWIDYSGDGNFNNTNEQIFYQDNITPTSLLTVNFTTPTTLSGNTVRLRVVEDLWSGYGGGAAFNNTSAALALGGQAEDYPVFLQANPLPITLITFSGKKENNSIQLFWKTSEEINAASFTIERAKDGNTFNEIGTVMTGSINNSYSFADYDISRGNYFYRLKMIDKDNSFSYSKIINFNIAAVKNLQVFGNPFKDKIKIILPYQAGNVTFRLFNATGKTLISKTMHSSPSVTELTFAAQRLPKGIYVLETIINGERYINKLVKE